jgi:serine/threonine protein kinase
MVHLVPSLEPGTEIGKCRIVRLLGRGGMGEVYLAKDLILGRQVALKIVRSDVATKQSTERFVHEARMAAQLDHPNVVTVFHAGVDGGVFFSVMQYIEGQNLSEVSLNGPQPWQLAASVIYLATQGLIAVHAKGLIHRDIKPSNIMLSTDRRVVLMDFGLVRSAAHSDLTESGQVMGTPPFMSPEQCRGEDLDRRTDIYSLGATLYAMLAGRPPFLGEHLAVIHQVASDSAPAPLQNLNSSVPAELYDCVGTAMSRRLPARFQSAREMSRSLLSTLRKYSVDIDSYVGDASRMSMPTRPIGSKPIVNRNVPQLPKQDQPNRPIVAVPVSRRLGSDGRNRPLALAIGFASIVALTVLTAGWMLWLRGYAPQRPPNLVRQRPDTTGMVLIPQGTVQVGANLKTIEDHWKKYVQDQQNIDRLMRQSREQPNLRTDVAPFWIDQYEVTNAQYKEFVDATGRDAPSHWIGSSPPAGKQDHPVVNVTYSDAEAYTKWAGKNLPTQEQWLRAFRGDSDQLFPWGDDYDGSRANVLDNREFPKLDTSSIKASPNDLSRFGVYNMVGNVAELIRGSFEYKGQVFRVSKVAGCNAYGFELGAASMQWRYGDHDCHKGLGFRCVIEITSSTPLD